MSLGGFPPNILWIVAEDHSPDLGSYGDGYAITPNLDRLATGSVMGTSGAHNPTPTAQALAWRTAEHIAEHWSSLAE